MGRGGECAGVSVLMCRWDSCSVCVYRLGVMRAVVIFGGGQAQKSRENDELDLHFELLECVKVRYVR